VEKQKLIFGWLVNSPKVCHVISSSLPSSFFKAPTNIISSFESLFHRFFWGDGKDTRKTSWMD